MAIIAITVQGTPWEINDVDLTIRRDLTSLADLTVPTNRITTQQLYSALQNRFDERRPNPAPDRQHRFQ